MIKNQLTCEDVQKDIPDFINDKLDSRDTLAFISHIRECKTCMEELSVEYLVLVGVKRLDSASAFNLNDELEDLMIRNEYRAIRKRNLTRIVFVFAIGLAILGGYLLSGMLYG